MIKYRDHRGGLDESMQTLKEFESIEDLKKYVIERSIKEGNPLRFVHMESSHIEIKEYSDGPDKRIGWDKTYIVIDNVGPIGFCDSD